MPLRAPILIPLLALLGAAPLAAQRTRAPSAAAVRRAVETITEAEIRGRVAIMSDDSMRGRATPSPELDETAEYLASEFRRLGLRPGGDSGSYIQRYAIQRSQADSGSFVVMMGRGATARWVVGRDASVGGLLPESEGVITAPAVLVVGTPPDTARPFGSVSVRGAVVLQALPVVPRFRGGGVPRLVAQGAEAGALGWVFLVNAPEAQFGAMARSALRPQSTVVGPQDASRGRIPVLVVRDSSAGEVLRAAGEELAALRDTATPGVRALSGVTVTIGARRRVTAELTAPNVVGILEGGDPELRGEAVVFSAHMDHSGVGQPVNGDSIYNGADDDASGTAGVVELAEAFASLQPRPRRSLVFLAVSGEERGLWGSSFYAEHPAVPLGQTVADLNMDMIGRNWRDTISVIGKEHSTLGATANRVSREHPELNMRLVDDLWPDQDFYNRSDHVHFARRGVPILFFFNGTHPDYHRPSDSVEKIDAEKAARIVRMVFYVGLEVANAAQRPQWDPESRRRVVQAGN